MSPHLRPIVREVGFSVHGPGVMSYTMFINVFFYCILTLGNSDLSSRKIHLEITTFSIVFRLNIFRCKYP